jgi:hypothetical protein
MTEIWNCGRDHRVYLNNENPITKLHGVIFSCKQENYSITIGRYVIICCIRR